MAENDFGLDDAILSAAEDLLKETDGVTDPDGAAQGGEAGTAEAGSGFHDVPIASSQHKVGRPVAALGGAAMSFAPIPYALARDGRLQPAPRREGSDDIAVVVSNPTKVGEGINSYMQYDVTTRVSEWRVAASRPAADGGVAGADQSPRFWLLHPEGCPPLPRLFMAPQRAGAGASRRHRPPAPGEEPRSCVGRAFACRSPQPASARLRAGRRPPPRPGGALSGRFTEEFVEERRRALEKFINRVAAHPDLRATRASAGGGEAGPTCPVPTRGADPGGGPSASAGVFRTFLEADPSQLVSTKEASAAEQRSAGKGFMQWFGETVTSISQSCVAAGGWKLAPRGGRLPSPTPPPPWRFPGAG